SFHRSGRKELIQIELTGVQGEVQLGNSQLGCLKIDLKVAAVKHRVDLADQSIFPKIRLYAADKGRAETACRQTRILYVQITLDGRQLPPLAKGFPTRGGADVYTDQALALFHAGIEL